MCFKILSFFNIINHLTNKPTRISIGNLTSQIFVNIYLYDFYFYVEKILKPKFRKANKNIFYLHYVDDFQFNFLKLNKS